MKKFFEDYKDLCKHTGQFYKDHWVATLLFTTVGTALSCALIAIYVIKDKKHVNENLKVKENNSTEDES